MLEGLSRSARAAAAAGLAVLCLGGAATAAGEDLSSLAVGHWVKAKGHLDDDGRFVVSEVEILPPDDEESIVGTATAHGHPGRFYVLGQEVHVDSETAWSGLDPGDPKGMRVKVQGRYRGPRNFSADEVEHRDKGRDRIEGRVDRLDRRSDGLHFRIMGFELFAPTGSDVEVEDAESIEVIELAPLRLFNTELAERDDDDDIRGTIEIGPNLRFGGQLEVTAEHERDFDLDETDDEDRTDLEGRVRGELVWEPGDTFFALAGFSHTERWRYEDDEPDEQEGTTRLSEAYGYWRDVLGGGFDLQAGRQDFDEQREWLYDQNLDAVRVIKDWSLARLELSASTVLFDGSPRDEDTVNLIAYLSNGDYDRHAAVWAMHRAEDSDELATHLGTRAYGDWLPGQETWLEAAYLFGESGDLDLASYGYDVGTTIRPDAFGPFSLTVGYAWGSGDDDLTDGTDESFRQTGLHDNNGKFDGVTSFRYYGELAEPELSNLGIWTLGAGARIARQSSIDVVWHKYDQVEAAPFLLDSELDERPSGTDADLGWELDVVFGSRAIDGWHFEVIAGMFEPGDAFPDDAERAYLGKVQVRFSF